MARRPVARKRQQRAAGRDRCRCEEPVDHREPDIIRPLLHDVHAAEPQADITDSHSPPCIAAKQVPVGLQSRRLSRIDRPKQLRIAATPGPRPGEIESVQDGPPPNHRPWSAPVRTRRKRSGGRAGWPRRRSRRGRRRRPDGARVRKAERAHQPRPTTDGTDGRHDHRDGGEWADDRRPHPSSGRPPDASARVLGILPAVRWDVHGHQSARNGRRGGPVVHRHAPHGCDQCRRCSAARARHRRIPLLSVGPSRKGRLP